MTFRWAHAALVTTAWLTSVCVPACSEQSPTPEVDSTPSLEADLLRAKQHLDRGRLDTALEVVERAVAAAPKHAQALLLWGSILEKIGSPHRSRDAFERALALDDLGESQRLFALTRLTYLCLSPVNVLDLEKAGEYLSAAREAGLPEREAVRLEAMRLECLDQRDDAIATYRRAIEVDPEGVLPRRGLAALLIRSRRTEEARSLLREALDRQFREPASLWLLRVSHDVDGTEPSLESRYRLPERSPTGPTPAFRLTDVGPAMGVNRLDGGRASAWGDFDGDGDLDLATVGSYRPNALFRNDGERFVDVAREVGFAPPGDGWGCLAADIDNDGDLDLLVTRSGWFGDERNLLYLNDGEGHFEEVGERAGLNQKRSSLGAAWADYDLDGDLDLYVANGVGAASDQGSINSLYRNDGTGRFVEVAAELGVADARKSIGTAWGDIDGDGDPDLVVANLGDGCRLYRNDDGRFTDVTAEAQVRASAASYVPFFFDMDADGDLDLFVTSFSSFVTFASSVQPGSEVNDAERLYLYRNDGKGRFQDVTRRAGLARAFGAMGANWGDLDNDGFPEIYLGNGGPFLERLEPNALFHNRGDGTFQEETRRVGGGHIGKGHGVTFADFDRDGDLDIYAPLGGAYRGDQWENALYRNDGGEAAGHSITIACRGSQTNRFGIGVQLRAFVGERVLYREIEGGAAFGSSNPAMAHFGLGIADHIDRLEVLWPAGGTRQVVEDLPADHYIVITEGEALLASRPHDRVR